MDSQRKLMGLLATGMVMGAMTGGKYSGLWNEDDQGETAERASGRLPHLRGHLGDALQ